MGQLLPETASGKGERKRQRIYDKTLSLSRFLPSG